jgi:hypothetical protein
MQTSSQNPNNDMRLPWLLHFDPARGAGHIFYIENIGGRLFLIETIEGWAVDLTSHPNFLRLYFEQWPGGIGNGFTLLGTRF